MYLSMIETLYHTYVPHPVPKTLEGSIQVFQVGLELGLRLGLELGEPLDWEEDPPPPAGPGG